MSSKHRLPVCYPPSHKAGMRVPKGGSSCSSCAYLRDAIKRICGNPGWVKWHHGNPRIPAPIDEYCCDLYEPRRAP